MKKLLRLEKYTREEIHDIFSPDTKFTSQAGTWGFHGIVKVPNTKEDYVFFVTYGKSQDKHYFDESIDNNGILTWESQPSQNLKDKRIIEFINHNEITDNIYLFLRTDKEIKEYTYMGFV